MLKEDEAVLAFISQHPKTRLTEMARALGAQQALIVGALGRLERTGVIRYLYRKIGERDNPARPLDFEYEFQVLRPLPATRGDREVTWAELIGRTPPPLAEAERSVLDAIEQAARRGAQKSDAAPAFPSVAVPAESATRPPASAPCAICGTTLAPNLIVRPIATKHGDFGLQRLCKACGHALGDLDMEEYRGRLYANAMNALAEAGHILERAPGNARAEEMLAQILALQDTFDSRAILFQCEIDAGGKGHDYHER